MGLLRRLRGRLRRRPVDPARVLTLAEAEARQRALRRRGMAHGTGGGFGGGGFGGGGDGFGDGGM